MNDEEIRALGILCRNPDKLHPTSFPRKVRRVSKQETQLRNGWVPTHRVLANRIESAWICGIPCYARGLVSNTRMRADPGNPLLRARAGQR